MARFVQLKSVLFNLLCVLDLFLRMLAVNSVSDLLFLLFVSMDQNYNTSMLSCYVQVGWLVT